MYNQATEIKRELLERVSKLCFEGRLLEGVDRIPLEMRPKGEHFSRCCIHKDRAVIRHRLMTILGFKPDEELDELTTLKEYAQLAKMPQDREDVMLTVVDEACSSCLKYNYTVTNLCRGCVGHPCTYACNKSAISVRKKAHIDQDVCVSCGRCMQACPYHAIVYTPVPCEEACPVKAISKDYYGIEHIDPDKCIACGKCKDICSYGAIMSKTTIVQIIRDIMDSGKRVVAMVAPAFAGQYQTTLPKILSAVKACGFDEVVEVAKGANMTTSNEAQEWKERVEENGEPFMTTSCCPSYKLWAEKYMPELVPYISHTATPASYTAKLVKEQNPDAITVFISPCVAKRVEGIEDHNIDYVMTFEEVDAMMRAKGIIVEDSTGYIPDSTIDTSGRMYAKSGGVASSVVKYLGNPAGLKTEVINGINRDTLKILKAKATTGKSDSNLVEVMMCEGGCVNGCVVLANPKVALRQLNTLEKNL